MLKFLAAINIVRVIGIQHPVTFKVIRVALGRDTLTRTDVKNIMNHYGNYHNDSVGKCCPDSSKSLEYQRRLQWSYLPTCYTRYIAKLATEKLQALSDTNSAPLEVARATRALLILQDMLTRAASKRFGKAKANDDLKRLLEGQKGTFKF